MKRDFASLWTNCVKGFDTLSDAFSPTAVTWRKNALSVHAGTDITSAIIDFSYKKR